MEPNNWQDELRQLAATHRPAIRQVEAAVIVALKRRLIRELITSVIACVIVVLLVIAVMHQGAR